MSLLLRTGRERFHDTTKWAAKKYSIIYLSSHKDKIYSKKKTGKKEKSNLGQHQSGQRSWKLHSRRVHLLLSSFATPACIVVMLKTTNSSAESRRKCCVISLSRSPHSDFFWTLWCCCTPVFLPSSSVLHFSLSRFASPIFFFDFLSSLARSHVYTILHFFFLVWRW